jgi:hypothetical protein
MARPRAGVEDPSVNEYRQTVIDDRYMADWLEFGFSELAAYLANQARFERYLSDHEPRDSSGDGPHPLSRGDCRWLHRVH